MIVVIVVVGGVVDIVVIGVGVVGGVELFKSRNVIVVGYCHRVLPLKPECRYHFLKRHFISPHKTVSARIRPVVRLPLNRCSPPSGDKFSIGF